MDMKHIPMGRRSRFDGRPPRQPNVAGRQDKGSRDPKPNAAIDTFIDRGLHELYDVVLKEDVPESLLRLIEDDRKK